MKVTRQNRREAKQLLRACVVNGTLDESRVREVVKRCLESRPRGFPGILSHFQRLLRLEVSRRTATIESAAPLSADLQARLQDGLIRSHGSGLRFQYVQNPNLLAGLRIKVGSDVYDGSVRARLAALEQSF